jgi:predicted phosphodiesterase
MSRNKGFTRDDAQAAAHILRDFPSVAKAMPAIRERLGIGSDSALRDLFARFGFDSPGQHVGLPRTVSSAGPIVEKPAKASTRIIVCPDAHFPFVDPRAWNCFLGAVETVRPDVLVIIGDFADCYSVSSHTKDPSRKMGFDAELKATEAGLKQLYDLRVPRTIYCEGNHEFRLHRYLAERAPEIYGLTSIRDLLQIERMRGWEWHDYKTLVHVGKMAFTHDVGRAGVNATRDSLKDFGDNLVFGHTHRLGVAYEGTVEEGIRVCMNVGWLGDYEAIDYRHKFMARRSWQHGFGSIVQDEHGVSWCEAVPIIGGQCMIDNRKVAA